MAESQFGKYLINTVQEVTVTGQPLRITSTAISFTIASGVAPA